MASLYDKIKFIYAGGKLKRFHARDTLTEQNIADHSFGVAWLTILQYDIESPPRSAVIMAAMSHDLGEHIAGDVPGDTKKRVPELKAIMNRLEDEALASVGLTFSLTNAEERIIKFADLMEGLMFCIRERHLGSRVCEPIWSNYWKFAMEMQPQGRTLELLQTIQTIYGEVRV